MSWIPIAEKLPLDNEEVWCYDAEYREVIGYHNRYGWFHVYGDNDGLGDDKLCEITHWQPLPRPSKPPGSNQHTKSIPNLTTAILSSLPNALQGKLEDFIGAIK